MLKAVVDTNVFISGLLKDSITRQIIILLKNSKFTPVISTETLGEFIDVISRPKFHKVITREIAEELIEIIKIHAVLIKSGPKVTVIKEDPDDNRFLETAAASKADFIVSGDSHLLSLKNFHNIPIITPKEFLSKFK